MLRKEGNKVELGGSVFRKLSFEFSRLSVALASRLQNNFYLYLAAVMSLGLLLDAATFHIGENMKQKAFDFVVRQRVIVPKPDPDIVIVDINEASLSALAPEYGRWPWPRQVFGEFVTQLEQQNPKAIVFDVLFSDADVQNPDSDAFFNEAIAATNNSYLPFLRLPTQFDSQSQVKPSMIPGVEDVVGGQADKAATIAVVLPHFEAALKKNHLGTHNIYPDDDGIVREYRLWQDTGGWRLPSLPLLVSKQSLDAAKNLPQDMLVNWRGGPFTYHSVSFSEVYRDITAKSPKRPANEFTGKIVIIGSTAPSLFDLKATAMAKMHPGVEILATAIDNLKHDDYLRIWRGSLPYILFSLPLLWLTALGFYHNIERDRFASLFGMSQLLLLAISYIGIQAANIYIDLTAPVTWAIAYFSIAKIYAFATDRAMQRILAKESTRSQGVGSANLLIIDIVTQQGLSDALLKNIRKALEAETRLPCMVNEMKGIQGGVWGLFSDMITLTWTSKPEEVLPESQRLLSALPAILKKLGLPAETTIRHQLNHAALSKETSVEAIWRTLFASTVLMLEQKESK